MRADELHRTARAFVEDERFGSLQDAIRFLETFVLQVDVPAELTSSEQALLLTVINTASRAFLGGVHVRILDNVLLTHGWGAGMRVDEATVAFGGQTRTQLEAKYPTVAIGSCAPAVETVVWPTWNGWSGGVVTSVADRLAEPVEFALAAPMAGAMAVAECFQRLAGEARACRRSFGVSLWRPDLDWRSDEAVGPPLTYLPSAYWLPGLGHLGQAYSWLIGLLPYLEPAQVSLTLQDFDVVERANQSTGLLSTFDDVGRRKTRVVADRLERAGFRTAIVERPFDGSTRRSGEDPLLCLGGFDSPLPRRALGAAGFDRVVDAGLGAGLRGYLDMLVQSIPAGLDTSDAFPDGSAQRSADDLRRTPAFNELVGRLLAAGQNEGDAECGMVEVAGTTAAASFVGAVAAAIVLSEPLRLLHGGESYEAIALSLRSPERVEVAVSETKAVPVFGTTAAI